MADWGDFKMIWAALCDPKSPPASRYPTPSSARWNAILAAEQIRYIIGLSAILNRPFRNESPYDHIYVLDIMMLGLALVGVLLLYRLFGLIGRAVNLSTTHFSLVKSTAS